LLTKQYSGDEIEKIEIGGACSTCGGRANIYTGSLGKQAEVRRYYAKGPSRNGMTDCTGLIWLKTGTGGELL
jgi:hypothetical protein